MEDQEHAEKAAFAALLIKKPDDPFYCALQVITDDTGRALKASIHWPNDEFVLGEIERLRAEGVDIASLPGKAELCQKIWDKMNANYCPGEDFVKMAKLYAEVRGFIEKPGTQVNVQNNFVQKVIEVANHGTDAEWEATAAKQQQELLSVAKTRH